MFAALPASPQQQSNEHVMPVLGTNQRNYPQLNDYVKTTDYIASNKITPINSGLSTPISHAPKSSKHLPQVS